MAPCLDIVTRRTCGKNGSCWEFLHVVHGVGVTRDSRRPRGEANSPVTFFLLRMVIFGHRVGEGQIKIWGDSGEMWACVQWAGSNQSYTIFLTWLFRKLKFLTPTVDFAPLPPPSVPYWFMAHPTRNVMKFWFSTVFHCLIFLKYDALSSGKLSPTFRENPLPSHKRHTTLGTTQRLIPNISFFTHQKLC